MVSNGTGADASQRPKRFTVTSERKRQQEVSRYLATSLRGPNISNAFSPLTSDSNHVTPPDFVPTPPLESVAALTAIAQLAAIRLGCSRSLISLIGTSEQHVLTEATPSSRLRFSPKQSGDNSLWLGWATIPRCVGICEATLGITPTQFLQAEVFEVPDLTADKRYAHRVFSRQGNRLRYYAGVPLVSQRGVVIGALCTLDEQPHAAMDIEHRRLMYELASTIVDFIETLCLKEERGRAKAMLSGLTNFIRGGDLTDYNQGDEAASDFTDDLSSLPPLERASSSKDSGYAGKSDPRLQRSISANYVRRFSTPDGGPQTNGNLGKPSLTKKTSDIRNPPTQADTVHSMSRKAAKIITETGSMGGVTILDAALAGLNTGRRRTSGAEETTRNMTESDFASQDEGSGHAPTKDDKPCPILASYSLHGRMSPQPRQKSISNKDVRRIIKLFPNGHVFHFDAEGEFSSDFHTSSANSGNSSPEQEAEGSESDQKITKRVKRRDENAAIRHLALSLRQAAPGARSLMVLPVWDSDSQRWFATFVCWCESSNHMLSSEDLGCLQAFVHSYMAAITIIREVDAGQAKTSFMASVSHELRSPLHGILGGSELLRSTPLDATQSSMLHSIETCGKTLLDTVDHVLEYTKSKALAQSADKALVQVKDEHTVRFSSRPVWRKSAIAQFSTPLDLAAATEEVTEAAFAGQSFRTISHDMDHDNSVTGFTIARRGSEESLSAPRKLFYLSLSIPRISNWRFNMPAGAWRRILMNIFGNALRYTETGYVKVSLQVPVAKSKTNPKEKKISVVIEDTGIGISEDFLATQLFQPFVQQSSFTAGLGLGLSVVRQIVESIGGEVQIESEADKGTTVTVTLNAMESDTTKETDSDNFGLTQKCNLFRGRKACLLKPSMWEVNENISRLTGIHHLAQSLEETLVNWLDLEVFRSEEWIPTDKIPDIVFCGEPNFEYLDCIRKNRKPGEKAPVIVFLAVDAMEATTLRSDARVLSNESVVEIITQPLGPLKLAELLRTCADRYFGDSDPGPEVKSHQPQQQPAPEENGVPPAVDLKTVSSPPNVPSAPSTAAASLHVLIVDDNAINRKLLSTLLKKRQLTFEEAVNGLEAVNMYKEQKSHFDVILMDISMPVMDGVTATTKIREHQRHEKLGKVTIIALTGLTVGAKKEMMEAGADEFMTKPVNFQKLMSLLPLPKG